MTSRLGDLVTAEDGLLGRDGLWEVLGGRTAFGLLDRYAFTLQANHSRVRITMSRPEVVTISGYGSLSYSNKVSVVQQSHGMHPLTSLLPYSNDHFSPSPPHLPTDMSQKTGVHRHQSQDLSGYYSLPPGGVGQITPSMSWFPHSLMLGPSGVHPTGIPHPAIVPPSGKQEHDQYDRGMYMKPQVEVKREKEPKKPVIKKPLNAFMLYMKEMRAKVIAECTLKESAAINQILGRRWHALTREEQAKYYELARKERQLHMQLYPTWSARDNYEAGLSGVAGEKSKADWGKKKRRKREKQQDSNTDPGSPKKCRARFGLNQQTDWCGPCSFKLSFLTVE
ncbi:hypothetical protein ATANTOWER_006637 [Ataeniobius toweri]|uniref:HMG box domain-containing protein n=1 Tax=Ataeniobius toweri TaxID=208326 RepID=A0ABU7A1E3_9TELE|nr:hypothetical protein [Ataeniobius toweri]